MAYPFEFLKVTFGGSIFSGTDIWVNSMNFGKELEGVGFEGGDWSTAIGDVADAVENWFKAPATNISNQAQLEWVKLAYINPDGLYFREPTIHDYATPIPGAGTFVSAPQNTIALTFETSKMRAPGRFGRIYPPLNVPSVQFSGMIANSEAEGMRDSAVDFINELAASLRIAGEEEIGLIVASQKTPRNYLVSKVKVGLVIDTQRSRRNAFTETYTAPAAVGA